MKLFLCSLKMRNDLACPCPRPTSPNRLSLPTAPLSLPLSLLRSHAHASAHAYSDTLSTSDKLLNLSFKEKKRKKKKRNTNPADWDESIHKRKWDITVVCKLRFLASCSLSQRLPLSSDSWHWLVKAVQDCGESLARAWLSWFLLFFVSRQGERTRTRKLYFTRIVVRRELVYYIRAKRERERERERVCVSVCVWERERLSVCNWMYFYFSVLNGNIPSLLNIFIYIHLYEVYGHAMHTFLHLFFVCSRSVFAFMCVPQCMYA